MAEPDVAIGEAELNRIGEYVQSHLPEWMDKLGVRPVPDPVTNTHLLERVVRVEEELKAQREVMTVRFSAMDERFEAMNQSLNDRFEAMNRNMNDRFEAVNQAMNSRFEAVNDRFDSVNQNINVLKWFVVTSFVVLGAAISLLAVLS